MQRFRRILIINVFIISVSAFQAAGLYCLSQLALSISYKKHLDKTKDRCWIDFYDNLKSPFESGPPSTRSGAGDGRDDCQPEFMAEELCKAVVSLLQKSSLEMKNYQTSQGILFIKVTI